MMDAPVVIAGAGPVGLALAVGLAHHHVRSVVLEEHPALSRHSKAPGVLPRTQEIFRAWGVLDTFYTRGVFLSRVEPWKAAVDYLNLDGRQAGTVSRGIMEWVGDEVRFHMAKPGGSRPADFVPGSGTLSQWRRQDKR